MSDDVDRDEELLDTARREVFESIGRYAEGWSSTEGGLVTKFVALAEIATPDGDRALLEVRGAGADGSERLWQWDRAGLLFEALHDPTERAGYSE